MRAIFELQDEVNSRWRTTVEQLKKEPDDEYLRGRRDAYKTIIDAFDDMVKRGIV